jgi:hypothetical protein
MAGFSTKCPEIALGLSSAVVVLTALLVPLCFNPWGSSAFELPKAVLLCQLVVPAAVVVALTTTNLAFASRNFWRKYLVWLLPVLGMASALILATIFSTNPQISFFGSYQRQHGLLTQSAYLALFVVGVVSLNTQRRLDRLWAALVWGSVPVVVYALLQWLGMDPFRWDVDGSSSIVSTLGRANFLGSYLVLVMPLTAAFWGVQESRTTTRRWLVGLLMLGQFVIIALTLSRSAWIGLATALAVAFALNSHGWHRVFRSKLLLSMILAVCLLSGAVLLASAYGSSNRVAVFGFDLQNRLQDALNLNTRVVPQ